MITKKELPACPVATTVNLIGNKWKILILRDLLVGKKRFGELRKSVSGISQKVLTDNLRSLENDGIVIRNIFAEVPPRVEYSLSELGETLRPIIEIMAKWGTAYKARFEDI
jgi:DNA-binding HxlR family transcriptional regulator